MPLGLAISDSPIKTVLYYFVVYKLKKIKRILCT